MSECSHDPKFCWCQADSWAYREAEPLRAENERLRSALNDIYWHWGKPIRDDLKLSRIYQIARQALTRHGGDA